MTTLTRILLFILAPFGIIALGMLFYGIFSAIRNKQHARAKMNAHVHWGYRGQAVIGFTPEKEAIEKAMENLTPKHYSGGLLLPGGNSFVWYVGGPEAKLQYADYSRLQKQYRSWGLYLKYIRETLDDISQKSLRYNFPGKNIDPTNVADPHFISEDLFHKKVCESLDLPYDPNSRYLLFYNAIDGGTWDVFDVTSSSGEDFLTKAYACSHLVGVEPNPNGFSGPFFHISRPEIKDEEDAFDAEMKEMAEDVRQKIRDLVMSDFSVEVIERWIQEAVRPSRIKISGNYRIFLTDYGKEIKLKQLPKALFLFFLKHEEGCRIKELQDYREELLSIYNKLTIFDNQQDNANRIDQLVDPLGTSFIEKCSIIKKAFVTVISDARAKPYYIFGEKGGAKRISLDRSLVDWEVKL